MGRSLSPYRHLVLLMLLYKIPSGLCLAAEVCEKFLQRGSLIPLLPRTTKLPHRSEMAPRWTLAEKRTKLGSLTFPTTHEPLTAWITPYEKQPRSKLMKSELMYSEPCLMIKPYQSLRYSPKITDP